MSDKKIFSNNFGLYSVLTDPIRGYEYVTEVLVELSVKFVQLRMKNSPPFKVLKMAEKLRKITEGTSTIFIVNDMPEVARDSAADGVHIGQDDMPFSDVRNMLGPSAIIGISTHNPDQTENACALLPDYIGVGPVYPTPTKDIPDPVLGLETMKIMLDKASVPATAIGGITMSHLSDVLKAGAQNFCMVRPICSDENPRAVIKKIQAIHNQYRS